MKGPWPHPILCACLYAHKAFSGSATKLFSFFGTSRNKAGHQMHFPNYCLSERERGNFFKTCSLVLTIIRQKQWLAWIIDKLNVISTLVGELSETIYSTNRLNLFDLIKCPSDDEHHFHIPSQRIRCFTTCFSIEMFLQLSCTRFFLI